MPDSHPDTRSPEWQRKFILLALISIAVILLLATTGIIGITALAYHDVKSHLPESVAIKTELTGVNLSWTHLLWVEFSHTPYDGFSKVYWYLKPWRGVMHSSV